MNKCGYLYIAIGKKYVIEAEISARSLKRFTEYPLCIITDDANYENDLFDIIMHETMPGDFVAKIIGVAKTPFERTVYLDNDTFICTPVDEMFDVLDFFDMSLMPFPFLHSYSFFNRYNSSYKLKYEKIIPEYHFGVMIYKMNDAVKNLMNDWIVKHEEMHIKADCSSFREAYFKHIPNVRISPLPLEYNYHGTHSIGIAYNEIKIIHERLGEKWNTLTTVMLPFEKMEKKAKRMNKYHCKRIIIPYIGVIPYTFSPYHIKYKFKKMLGIKRTKKAETF
ncbi:MAG: hypothetical protein ACR2FN_14575 [Chitinophagaceae bacterium]